MSKKRTSCIENGTAHQELPCYFYELLDKQELEAFLDAKANIIKKFKMELQDNLQKQLEDMVPLFNYRIISCQTIPDGLCLKHAALIQEDKNHNEATQKDKPE